MEFDEEGIRTGLTGLKGRWDLDGAPFVARQRETEREGRRRDNLI